MIQNDPVPQRYHDIKAIFGDIFIFSPAVGHPGSTLRKFSEDLKKTHYDPFIEINVSD